MNDDSYDDKREEPSHPLDMDAITAHLDRGWDLLGRGDMEMARLSAHHILQLDDQSPEGHTLLGAIVAAEGDPHEAMDLFMRALDVDPEYLDALIYAAELAIQPLGDLDAALSLCDQAEELMIGGDEPEAIEIKLLRAEARLAAGELEEARRALVGLPEAPLPDAVAALRAGRIFLELELPERAVPLLEQSLDNPMAKLDSHYFLGIGLELLGRRREAMAHLRAVYELDVAAEEPTWALDDEAFAAAVNQVLTLLETPQRDEVAGAHRVIAGMPSLELVHEGFDPRAGAYFAGLPAEPPERDAAGRGRRAAPRKPTEVPQPELACVFIYKRNVERFAGSAEGVLLELYRVLAAELGAFYALEDEAVEALMEGAEGLLGPALGPSAVAVRPGTTH